MGIDWKKPPWLYKLLGCLLILQIGFPCYGGSSGCPKLDFLSSHGCRPCSLCDDPQEAKERNLVRDECRRKNPEPFSDGRVLWCDSPEGPFPECPAIHQSLESSCSENCKENFRDFAPGCICTVGCPRQLPQVVHCTEELRWSSTDIPEECVSPSPITMAPEDGDKPVLTMILGSVVTVILVVAILAITGTCFYKRLRSKFCPPRPSGPSAAPLLNGRAGSHLAPSEERSGMPGAGQEADENRRKCDKGSTDGSIVIEVDSDEVKKLPSTVVRNPQREREGVQQRELNREKDQYNSVRALKDLMGSRQDLVNLSKHFDQKYDFDKITWHDVAVNLLGWDPDDLHHTEYKYKCGVQSDSPGDGPMHKVLEEAMQEGKGLLDLIHCLGQLRKKLGGDGSKKAEDVLLNFWQNWKSQQAAEEVC